MSCLCRWQIGEWGGKKNGTRTALTVLEPQEPLDAAWLRDLCIQAGADDVGFVQIDRPELDTDRNDIREAAPWTTTLISFDVRMNRENIRSPMRSLANVEFHASYDQVTETSRKIVRVLEQRGIRAMHTAFWFSMEANRWPGKMWVASHKLVAHAAGLGKIGIHRNVIHPKFGSFIFLGTVLIDRRVAEYGEQIDFDPCLNCKLCVAACPTGAIKPDGEFDFSACYTHNYREFMGGFGDWVEQVADSKNAIDYRKRVSDSETLSMWQSLSFQSNYKAAYCLSVCPAGEDVIGPYLRDKKGFKNEIMKPLTTKSETIYVVPGSDAEGYVAKRFPHKGPRYNKWRNLGRKSDSSGMMTEAAIRVKYRAGLSPVALAVDVQEHVSSFPGIDQTWIRGQQSRGESPPPWDGLQPSGQPQDD